MSSRVCRGAVQGAPDHVCHWAVSGFCQRALQGAVQQVAPDHVCHGAVSGCCPGCCPGCSGSCLPSGGVRVLSRVLSRGAVEGLGCSGACLPGRCPAVLSRVLRIMFAIGRCQGAVNSLFQFLSGVYAGVIFSNSNCIHYH